MVFAKGLILYVIIAGNVFLANGVSVEEDLSLSQSQKLALDKFKTQVISRLPHDYMTADIYLIRWLRAKHFDLPQAEQMLMASLKWRKDNNMDNILKEDWSDMKDEFPYVIDTFDKTGRPVATSNLGTWDMRRAVLSGKTSRVFRYANKLLEENTQMVIQLQQEGKNVTQFKVIYNMEGFNILQHTCAQCLAGYASYFSTAEENYPGFVDESIIINTPATFQLVMAVLLPIFSPATRKSLKIFGTDKAQWMKHLDKEIDRDQRTVEYGGTRKD